MPTLTIEMRSGSYGMALDYRPDDPVDVVPPSGELRETAVAGPFLDSKPAAALTARTSFHFPQADLLAMIGGGTPTWEVFVQSSNTTASRDGNAIIARGELTAAEGFKILASVAGAMAAVQLPGQPGETIATGVTVIYTEAVARQVTVGVRISGMVAGASYGMAQLSHELTWVAAPVPRY